MELDWPAIILGAIGTTSFGAFITGLFSRRKSKADAAAVVTDSAMDLIIPLREEIKALRERVELVEDKLRTEERRTWALVAYVRRLIDALRAAGAVVPDAPETLQDIL